MERFLASELPLRILGASFIFFERETWDLKHHFIWFVIIFLALEILTWLVIFVPKLFGYHKHPIKARGQPFVPLGLKDWAFIIHNKVVTSVFTYHMMAYCWHSPSVKWGGQETTLLNTVVAYPLLYIVYDFFYTLFHRLIHVRGLYGWIHKHHHKQTAPSRGNLDAINVHPFEFYPGEYTHLLALYIVSQTIGVHVWTVVAFLLIGGVLASLNHTRYDVKFPVFPFVYSVGVHDVHHFFITANYGQYIMLWDWIFGWYRPYSDFAKDTSE